MKTFSDYYDENKEALEIEWFDDQVDDKYIVDYLIETKKFGLIRQAIINASKESIAEWACKQWQLSKERDV